MKKIILLSLTALMTFSCKPVPPEKKVADIYKYFSNEKFEPVSLSACTVDDLALALAADAGFEDLWTIDEEDGSCNLVGEIEGVKHPENTIVLSAALDNPEACAAVIETMKAFRKLKIKPNSTIKVAFYEPAVQIDSTVSSGMTTVARSITEKNSNILFNLEMTQDQAIGKNTFEIGGEKADFFNRITEIIPPYFAQYGSFHFTKGPEKDTIWPIAVPQYRFRPDGSLNQQAAALASFVFLMN